MKNEKVWIVPVEWTMCGFVKVVAKSAEEACHKIDKNNSDISIPSSLYAEYLEDSFTVPDVDNEAVERCKTYTKLHEESDKHFYFLNDLNKR